MSEKASPQYSFTHGIVTTTVTGMVRPDSVAVVQPGNVWTADHNDARNGATYRGDAAIGAWDLALRFFGDVLHGD